MTHRPSATIIVFLLSIFSSSSVRAQRYGDITPALGSLPLDPSVFGMPGRAFLEYSRTSQLDWSATGGLAGNGGVLRASVGQGYAQRILGLGYGRSVANSSLGLFGTIGAGFDLAGALDFSHSDWYASRAVRLSVPLSIRWGSPSIVSVTPYVAPYAELGHGRILHTRCVNFTCTPPITDYVGETRGGGLAAGFLITGWRIGLQANLRDALARDEPHKTYEGTVGLRFHF